MGASDPRLNSVGKLDFRLHHIIRGWKQLDGPSRRKKPVPKHVLLAATSLAHKSCRKKDLAMVDLIWIGFYFLLRPGEYLHTSKGRYPFRLSDVFYRVGDQEYPAESIPLLLLSHTTSVGLHFTMQKNGIPNEIIWMTGAGDDVYTCPMQAISRRICDLRWHNASHDIPLYVYYDEHNTPCRIADRYITEFLRISAQMVGMVDVTTTAGALRCTGATALLQAKVPVDLIKLVGRWRSDEVFRYLHTQSEDLMSPIAAAMLQHAS